ncbi:probable serine/threonine-protein kinase PBL5 [Triticum urartu]|nr:probable serine/threonine-protein kinase PBL5 [Triticum urartu]
MDTKISTRHKVDLEHMVLDESAEPTYLPLSLLQEITDSFSDDQQIGSGGFAVVYKGTVGKGMVAVKKLSITIDMHENKFHREVECLMKAKHKNIVRFLGYCSDTQGMVGDYDGKFVMADLRNWVLCFEYIPKGSLDKYITDVSCGLKWRDRYHIIKGTCEGLLHLHEKRILHLDLKPGNILLADHMVPKIADFGLSRCLDEDQTRAFTSHLCGSQGYLAPEFYRGQFTFASDIYSLGIIIVEILTGEKGYPEEENVVANWMNQLEASDQWHTQLEQVRVCTKIGIQCMDLNPKKRPVARHILDRLDKTKITIETGISGSSVEQQVSFLKEQYCQEKNSKRSYQYLGKEIKEHAETEGLAKYVEIPREDHWQQGQQEASSDQWPLRGVQDVKKNVSPQGASISSSNNGVLYKLNNLDIFDRKAHRNHVRYGGPTLENVNFVKLFKKKELGPILKNKNLIRRDSFGVVYMGLVDSVPVTIRKLFSGSVVQNEDFANEVIIQSQVIHGNMVRLIGCCLEFEVPMLVHEFHSIASLHYILHTNIKVPLNLGVRLSIAATMAGALSYVHSALVEKILHGNVKPSNILLDNNFVPKISDTGISRLIVRGHEHSGISIGDMAYMDPVYVRTSPLTQQSDVYSFGVIILELVTRRKATHMDKNSLVINFLENHKQERKSTELFDKEIAVTENLKLLDTLAGIAAECLNFDVDLRPTMVDVANRLSMLNQSYNLS